MIIDKTNFGSGHRKRVSPPWRAVVHRIGPTEQIGTDPAVKIDSSESLAKFFFDNPRLTGSPHPPYTFLCLLDGTIEQIEPLDIVTPHARLYNQTGCGIALVGDFRFYPPSEEQRKSLVMFLVSWLRTNPYPECIVGHDELVGAMRDEKKECPGHHLDMSALREEVRVYAAKNAATIPTLRNLGVVTRRR